MLSKINNPSAQNFPKFAIFSVKISFLTNKNKIFGISVLFYTGKAFKKSLLYFQFIFIERAVNTLVVLILNHIIKNKQTRCPKFSKDAIFSAKISFFDKQKLDFWNQRISL